MYFCKNSIAKTIVSRNARRVLISVWGLIFCLYNKLGVHNVTGLCTSLNENDFPTINGYASIFGFAARNREQPGVIDKTRYPTSTQR